ncbi:hypothetical protein [Pedobacter soli]|uniref:Uncharacterized protein n=1 Tax=Pedobacter soli TaxID=390242 RepID=A0A1G6WM46_9SPHI|nr:hypothetical protein [Pedobacter soli]SDD66864.1 hypothetical protein SAMN04488024_10760 [Pedobacter soli]
MTNQGANHKIEIKTVQIDGKKLTKSLFGQLGEYECLDANVEFTGDQILGYCNYNNTKYLLWIKGGLLKKTNLDSYRKILATSQDTFVENIGWFLRLTKIEFYISLNSRGVVSDSIEDQVLLDEKIDKLKVFLRSIKPDMQIFL